MRLLYTDVDGTLTRGGSLLHGARGPSNAAADALVELHRAGVEIVPVSGRRVPDLVEFARAIGASTCLAELGAALALDGGREVRATYEPPGGVPAHRALTDAGVVAHVLLAARGRLEMHDPWCYGREHTALLRGAIDTAAVAKLLPPGVVLLDNGPIERPPWSALPVPAMRAYHLTYEGVGKARGVAYDLARRGVAPEDAAFVGDSPEDARLVGTVGRVVLLGERVDGAEHVAERYGEGFREAARMLLP